MRLAAGLAVLVLVAGCADATGGLANATTSPSSPAGGQTAIAGKVLDPELQPVAGALVAVDELAPLLTDGAGQFRLAVEAGSHRVVVQAIGFNSLARTVDVADGQVVDVQFELTPLPIIEPYTELQIHDGYAICGIAAFVQVGQFPNDCPLGEPKTTFEYHLAASWRYLVSEVQWDTQDSFWVSIQTKDDPCLVPGDPCPGVEIGRSPLRIDGAPNDTAVAARYAIDGKELYMPGPIDYESSILYAGLLREELNATVGPQCAVFWAQFGVPSRLGCPLGVGYSTGIRFQEYLSVFHWERPASPSAYSAIPDG